MRQLSKAFLNSLGSGFLSGLTQRVIADKDLDLEIRENYINIYFKGNSLLRLSEITSERYRPVVHPKFLKGLTLDDFTDEVTVQNFLSLIPTIKENIVLLGKSSLEIEYEQMIIRANNYEPRNNSEYFIVDRQYAAGHAGRFDLTGFYWDRIGRRKGQVVPLCLIEVKFALNQDIQKLHEQLERYYLAVEDRAPMIVTEAQWIFRQKLELGLFIQPKYRLDAMKTLEFSPDIHKFQFIILLVDYNPYSRLFDLDTLSRLTFANQIRIFQGGFAMWGRDFKSLPELKTFPKT